MKRRSEPYRCLFVNCAAAQLISPGWLSKQSLVSHINNVHMAAGQMPTEEMLRVLGRGVCQKCKVLITTRGCPYCKGRVPCDGVQLSNVITHYAQSEPYSGSAQLFALTSQWVPVAIWDN